VYPLGSPTHLAMGCLSDTSTCLAARVFFMFVLLASIIPRSFIFAEYEFLTAVLVDTELPGNYLFWGVTCSAKTAQLSRIKDRIRQRLPSLLQFFPKAKFRIRFRSIRHMWSLGSRAAMMLSASSTRGVETSYGDREGRPNSQPRPHRQRTTVTRSSSRARFLFC